MWFVVLLGSGVMVHSYVLFVFFKQKTAYEMRISDWSSDVCSSDLVKALLQKQKPLLRFYWADNTILTQGLASGEIVAASSWNDAVLELRRQGVPVGYMKPKEGILAWCCGLVLAKEAPQLGKAYELIDAMISPEAGLYFITTFG